MKTLKRMLASIMVAVMVLTVAPLNGFVGLELNLDWLDFNTKASAETLTGTFGDNGDNLTWSFDTETGELVISGTGKMEFVLVAPWYSYSSSIKKVTIGDSVTNIGYYAFRDCTSLTNITIPDSITSIEASAFYDCTGLTDVYYNGTQEQWYAISIESNNSPLANATIHFAEVIGSGTYGDNLTWIFYDDGELVISGTGAMDEFPDGNFPWEDYCDSITSVSIDNGVTTIAEDAFADCFSLTSITLPDSITTVAGAFGDVVLSLIKDIYYNGTPNQWRKVNCDILLGTLQGTTIHCKDVVESGKCGDNVEWEFCSDGTLVITGTGAMYDYNAYDEIPWFEYHSSIKSASIENGITTISSLAFHNCHSLTNISIPDSVISIGEGAFYFTSLTSVKIPDGVTRIGYRTFGFCNSLESLTIGKGVKEIESDAFVNCSSFVQVHYTGELADWCEINFEEAESNPLTFCENVYINGETIPSNLVIPEGTTSIGSYTFYGCQNISVVTIPKSVTTIGNYAFSGCSNLKSATIGDGVTSIDSYTFANCPNLMSVTIPDSVIVIKDHAFEGCTSLATINMGGGITEIGDYAFYDYGGVPNIYYRGTEEEWNEIIVGSENYAISDGTVFFGKGICGENLVWEYDNAIGELVISGTGDMYDYGSKSEESAPWISAKSVIKTVVFSEGITSIGSYAFKGYLKISSVTIPEGVINIGAHAFNGCTGIRELIIPDGVTNIDAYAFRNCRKIKSLTIGAGVQNIGANAFTSCVGLTSVTIPGSVISLSDSVFSSCTGLTSVTIENGVETIGANAFTGCTGLTDVTIPDSVTSIDNCAFSDCTNLASVTIPAEIIRLNSYAFKNTPNLKDIYFKGNKHQWQYLIKNYASNFDLTNITVHYACGDSFENHSFIPKIILSATCTEKGQKEYSCACGEQYTEEIPAKGHSYTSVVVAPNCTDDGYTIHTCMACGDSYTDSETEATGHQYNSVVVKPNCTTGGYTIHTCTACGDSYKDSETEPSGHDYYQTVVVPTCKDGGYTVNTCRYCDDTYVSDEKGPAGHQYTSVVINPTCLNEGYTLSACNVCGASSISDKKPALGHEYIEQVTPPTCESEGYTTFTCTRGDHIYIDNRVAASGHDYEQTVFAPTCIQDGCTFNICNDCGRLHKSDVVAATGHSFGSWRTVISPAENKEGLEERYCKYCGYTEERTLPMTQRTAYTATFVADGKKVATIEFLKGTTSIEEPPVPHKDRYNGEWEDYTLGNADIVINAKYQPVALNNLSGISNNKTASYDASTGIANVTLTASSDAKTVITQSKERVPLDIVLVVDQSGSMNSNLGGRYSKKDSLIDSTYEFVDMVYEDALTNGIDHKIAIVGFGMGSKSSGAEYPAFLNTEILTTGRRPLGVQYATKEDYKNALMSVNQNGTLNGGITTAINSIDANGATAADYGLSMASSIFANNPIEAGENRQRIVIFISDGEPTYSSGFEVDVANAAIQQAHQLKNTHNATIYSVGVMTDAEAKSEKLNAFLARVSSDYMDARNIFGNADRVSDSFSINVDDTDNLSAMFGDIVTENVTQTTDFDNVTVIDTVSKYFTLTSQQEKDLRYSVISEYGVKNSDVEITRNEDGTTSIKISNIKTKPVETDGNVKYTVTISYEVSANENAATAGAYPICTDDSGIIIGDTDCYERIFSVPTAEIPENRNTVVFKVNGEVYAIKSVTSGSKVTVPETDFIGEYEFSGWDIPSEFVSDTVVSEFDSVLIRPEYVIIWNTENGTEKVTYSPGDIIDEPEVSPNANGEAFRRWNGTVPVQMPAESLEFTAVYGDHEHQYYTETIKEMNCIEDGEVKHICSVCNDSYTETVKSPGEHSWKAIAKPGDKDNSSSAYFECERCGICADKQLNYIITENEPNERGHFESLTHEFNYVDEEGNLYQPDGNIEIVTTVSDYFEDADSVNVYRIDENGNKVQCESEYDNGVLTFETNHFSIYVFEPYYSCQSTGEHGDEDCDGYCDRCDSVLKEFIDFIIKEGIEAQIDSENHILLGNDILNYSVEEVAGLFEFGNIYIEGKESGRIGTGDVICLTNDNGEVCNRLTAVIFGDVNGDGWYDGMDAVLVSCLANGMLTKDDVSEAVYMAADCNHDGVIDQLDVDLLNEAGALLANVDQSKPAEVLLETSSAYVEYLDLIDQSPEIETEETEDIPDADAEGNPETDVEPEDTTPEQDAKVDIFEMIMNFIKSIFEMLFACIPVPLK